MRAAATGLAGSGVLRCLAAGSQVGLSCRSEARFVPSGIFLCCTSLPRAGLRLIRLYNPMFSCRPGPASNGCPPRPGRARLEADGPPACTAMAAAAAATAVVARPRTNGITRNTAPGPAIPPPIGLPVTGSHWSLRSRFPRLRGIHGSFSSPGLPKFRGVSATCGILFFQVGSVGVIISM